MTFPSTLQTLRTGSLLASFGIFLQVCASLIGATERMAFKPESSTVVGHPATANCQSIFWGEDLSNRGVGYSGYSGYNATHKTGGASQSAEIGSHLRKSPLPGSLQALQAFGCAACRFCTQQADLIKPLSKISRICRARQKPECA